MSKRILLTCFLLLVADVAFSWGAEGHKLICGLAGSRLNAQGKAFVKSVLAMDKTRDAGSNQQPENFPQACLWPDDAKYSTHKGSYESHFINIPKGARSIDLSRDCQAMDCIVAGIQRNMVYLAAPAQGMREKARKAAALRYLGHLIGDLHQPLHVSHKEDRGGNLINVIWFGTLTNLHRVWDVEILQRSGLAYPQSLNILQRDGFRETQVNILEWMEESYRLARESAYIKGKGLTIGQHEQLTAVYFKNNKKIVIQQLIKAGNRLALLINQLAAGTKDLRFLQLEHRD